MKMLVGYTGFVGSNLLDTMYFDEVYNSKNIRDAYGKNPDLLIYAGVRGTKFLANKYPDDDRKNIEDAIENIKKINPKKLVLISTVDVYEDLDGKDEDYVINPELLHAYGKNRYYLEQWVINNIKDYHIIRLPAIYGKNLKKNFIHDLIDPVPQYLSKKEFFNINSEYKNNLSEFYINKNVYYSLIKYNKELVYYFDHSQYNSIRFTDSRSTYQYFDLLDLHFIINMILQYNIKIFNCVSVSIKSGDLFKIVFSKEFKNHITNNPIEYNLKTKYDFILDAKKFVYLRNKEMNMKRLANFINEERKKIR